MSAMYLPQYDPARVPASVVARLTPAQRDELAFAREAGEPVPASLRAEIARAKEDARKQMPIAS
jgi:hypothetical protein